MYKFQINNDYAISCKKNMLNTGNDCGLTNPNQNVLRNTDEHNLGLLRLWLMTGSQLRTV